jgi:glycosyltransferase involved in cell wall biosynthesis
MSSGDPSRDGVQAEPVVSAVLAVRDGELHLREAVDSVLAQDHPRVELIVVDDGSADASARIAESYGASVRVVSTPPVGIGGGRNRGVDEASGELIAFIDADDRWPVDRLSVQLEAMRRHPSPDLVFGHAVRFPDRHAVAEPARMATTMLVPRRVFDRVGRFSTEWTLGEFMDWLLRARELGLSEVMVPELVLHRRAHAHNHTRRHRHAFGDYARILQASLERRREAGG